jgi:hypothetical protein
MRRFTGPLPFSIEPHRHKTGVQGFEPCPAALETACSPRSTLLFRVSGGSRTRRHDLHRVACKTVTPQTPSLVPAGFEPAIFPMSRECPARYTTGLASTPTRIRTRNASFEARNDRPFHHRGVERKARESNPHLRWENRLSRAARPTVSGYLPFSGPTGN